jgi:hypothetical protein
VAGPLLAPGLVLAVDLVPVPHPHLATDYWGIPAGTHLGPPDRLPIDLLFVALGHVGLVAAGEKLLLLAIVFLAGWGMHRLVPTDRDMGRYFAGLLYAVNPFVYDRLDTGQWYLLLGYALLPWAFAALLPLAAGRPRAAWRFALLAVAVGVASAHMFALLAVLVLAMSVAALIRGPRRGARIRSIALGCGLAGLGSFYWLLPAPGLGDLWKHIGPAQLRLYQTVADRTWGLEAAVAGLYGYWNDAEPIKAHLLAWPLVAAALIGLALWGLATRRADPAAWAVAATAAFGFVLALGARGPLTGQLYRAALDHVGFLRSFREPQKGVALLAFGYAYLGGVAAGELRAHARRWWSHGVAVALAACVLLLPLLGGYRELGGLWGRLSTSTYPSSWSEARALLERQAAGSRTLVLPWHGYSALSFAGHRVVANPAAEYFDTPVLVSRSVGEGAAAADSSDPLDAAVARLLASGSRRHDLGACLATIGVSHILLSKQADWAAYAFLARQDDLVVERRWNDLILYRNTHPTSLALRVDHVGSGLCDTRVTPLLATVDDPAHLRLAQPASAGALVSLASPLGTSWMLGTEHSHLLAGAVPVVRADGRARTFRLAAWHTVRRNYLIGLLGLVLLVVTLLAAVTPRGRRARSGVWKRHVHNVSSSPRGPQQRGARPSLTGAHHSWAQASGPRRAESSPRRTS